MFNCHIKRIFYLQDTDKRNWALGIFKTELAMRLSVSTTFYLGCKTIFISPRSYFKFFFFLRQEWHSSLCKSCRKCTLIFNLPFMQQARIKFAKWRPATIFKILFFLCYMACLYSINYSIDWNATRCFLYTVHEEKNNSNRHITTSHFFWPKWLN